MAQHNPISGPMPIEEFRKLVDAPYGEAIKRLRKYDPLLGRKPGEKIEWRVSATRQQDGIAYVMAATEKEARELAGELEGDEFDWEDDDFNIDVESVTPE